MAKAKSLYTSSFYPVFVLLYTSIAVSLPLRASRNQHTQLDNMASEKAQEMSATLDEKHGSSSPSSIEEAAVGETLVVSPAVNRRLLWKIDLHLLPVLCLLYGLQFLDKTTISYASVMGIVKDTGLVGTQYNWLGSVFYLGYLVAEYPTVMLMQKLPIAKFLSAQIVIWGGILMCHVCSHIVPYVGMIY